MKKTYIRTYTGQKVDPVTIRPADISVIDIAHALSNNCRYTGHTSFHYSVAQHSVYVSWFVPTEHALWGLLHDASEAYLSDIARPIKHTPAFEQYRQLEKWLMRNVVYAFGLSWPEPPAVKDIDARMLPTEIAQLMGGYPEDLGWYGEPLPLKIDKWSPEKAREAFLSRFRYLTR